MVNKYILCDRCLKEYEDKLEKRIEELESMTGMGSQWWEDNQHEISNLKHQLWQSRL